MEKDELKKALREYLLTDCQIDLQALVGDDRKLASDTLKELIAEQKTELMDHTDKIGSVLAAIYRGSDLDTDDTVLLFHRYIADSYLYKDSAVCCKDEQLCGGLKNRYLFDLIEKIRFAKLQRQSLRDTTSYNRHIEKSISDMRNDLTVLFELQCSLEETESILEKYLEYNINVNTARNWMKLNGLSKYAPFQAFLIKSKPQLLNLFRRGSIRTESLKYYVESKDTEAIEVFVSTLAETAMESLERAKEMVSNDVCFPFDNEFILLAAQLAATERSGLDDAASLFFGSEKSAADNVLRICERVWLEDPSRAVLSEAFGKLLNSHDTKPYDRKNWLK